MYQFWKGTKQTFLEANGWKSDGIRHWVKVEWENESERLGLEPHLCPNWYRSENLDSAFVIANVEKAIAETKADSKYENAQMLERVLLEALRCGKDDMPSETRNFAKNMLLPWYLNECNNKPNPLIKIGYKIKTQFKLED